MTEPSPARPIPGPPRPGPGPRPAVPAPAAPVHPESAPVEPAQVGQTASEAPEAGASAFDGLAALPVAEHVAVFDEEHARLQRELSTIDQL